MDMPMRLHFLVLPLLAALSCSPGTSHTTSDSSQPPPPAEGTGAQAGETPAETVGTGAPAPELPLPTGSDCRCIWEGPVEATTLAARYDDDHVYLQLHLVWRPCCRAVTERTAWFAVDVSDGSVRETAEPADAEEIAAERGAGFEVTVGDATVAVSGSASDSVTVDTLALGTILRTGGEPVPLRVPVGVGGAPSEQPSE